MISDQVSTESSQSWITRLILFVRAQVLDPGWLRWCLPPLLLLTLFVVTGLRGIDYGYHWDERWHVPPAREMVATGLFLTRPYSYPGMSKLLVLVPALDDGLRALWHGGNLRQVLAAMATAMDAPNYLLQARSVCLVVSALAILWVYLAVGILTRRWWQATLAAALLGLSWEFAYHARFVATDCLLTQFSALCLLFLVLHLRRTQSGWLWAAAIAAGLGAGTKYPGALLLGPVMLCAAVLKPATLWQRIARVVKVGAIAVAAYLVTTPGTVLDPIIFTDWYLAAHAAYAKGHIGYTVPIGFPHFWRLIQYLLLCFFSPYAPIAIVCFVSAIVGAALSWRENRLLAAILTGFPLLFAIVFCWKYPVFIVRNYLLLTPFLAVLSARGLAEAFLRLRWPVARLALAIVIGSAFAANGVWLISAAESIRHRDLTAAAVEAVEYVRDHPRTRFRVSPRVASLSASRGLALPANAVETNVDEVVFFAMSEGPEAHLWVVNDPWLFRAVFGAWDVNFNYYSTWWGSDRVVVMTREKARASAAPLAK